MPAISAGAVLVLAILAVIAAFMIANEADFSRLLALGYPGVAVVMFF